MRQFLVCVFVPSQQMIFTLREIKSMSIFIKYFIKSIMGLGVDYIAVLIALACGIPYQGALFLGLCLGGIVGFLLLTYWVFPAQKSAFAGMRILSYLLGLGLIYIVRTGFMYMWYRANIYPEWEYVALFCAFGCSFLTNFAFQRFFYVRY